MIPPITQNINFAPWQVFSDHITIYQWRFRVNRFWTTVGQSSIDFLVVHGLLYCANFSVKTLWHKQYYSVSFHLKITSSNPAEYMRCCFVLLLLLLFCICVCTWTCLFFLYIQVMQNFVFYIQFHLLMSLILNIFQVNCWRERPCSDRLFMG